MAAPEGPFHTTFVSCLYDIGRREGRTRHREVDTYLWLAQPLFAARVPLVVFTDPHLATSIVDGRDRYGNGHLTQVVAEPLERFPAMRHRGATRELWDGGRRNATVQNLAKDTPDYAVVGWSKCHWLARVARESPFDSPCVAWIDIGIAHVVDVPEGDGLRLLTDSAPDAVRCCAITTLTPQEVHARDRYYAERVIPPVVGGFFTAGRAHAQMLDGWFDEELDRCMASGWPSHEETVLGPVVVDHPDVFETYPGHHATVLQGCVATVFAREQAAHQRRLDAARSESPESAGRAARTLLGEQWLSPEVEQAARALDCGELPLLGDLVTGARIGTIEVPRDTGWHNTNPTIASDPDGGFRAVVRQVNYEVADGGGVYELPEVDPVVRTRNVVVGIGDGLDVEWSREIDDRSPLLRGYGAVRGFEDLRLFRHLGRWHAVAVVAEACPDALPRTALLTFDDQAGLAASVLLRGPDPARVEKNWMPLAEPRGDGDAAPVVVYASRPATAFRVDATTGALRMVERHPSPVLARFFRGGSQLVRHRDGWLACVHETLWTREIGRWYQHRFVRFNRHLALSGASRPFRFVGALTEFCAGMALDQERVILTFGVQDRHAALAVIPLDGVESLLVDGCTLP